LAQLRGNDTWPPAVRVPPTTALKKSGRNRDALLTAKLPERIISSRSGMIEGQHGGDGQPPAIV